MEKIDFESENWKEQIRGKSPEEIAMIVENYYRLKYSEEHLFSSRRMVVLMVFCLVFFLALVFMFILFKSVVGA